MTVSILPVITNVIRDDNADHQIIGTDAPDLLSGNLDVSNNYTAFADYFVDGLGGIDTLIFKGTSKLTFDMAKSSQSTGYGQYTVVNVENILADDGNDVLWGNGAANLLYGGGGNDTIHGRSGNDVIVGDILGDNGRDRLYGDAGNDVLMGGAGNDTLTGGSGKDTFIFSGGRPNKKTNMDTITDFNVKADQMVLDRTDFKKLGFSKVGQSYLLKESAFHTGPSAHDGSDRIIYNDQTGALYYDADGTGGSAAIQFAKLKPGLALTHKDFFVI